MKKPVAGVFLMVAAALGTAYAVRLHPGDIAAASLRDGHMADAIAAYEKEREAGSLSAFDRTRLRTLYRNAGQLDKAISLLAEDMAASPENMALRNEMGDLALLANDLEGAVAHWQVAYRATPARDLYDKIRGALMRSGNDAGLHAFVADSCLRGHLCTDYPVVEAAVYEAARGRKTQALLLLGRLRLAGDPSYDGSAASLEVTLLLEARKPREALDLARQRLAAGGNLETLKILVSPFIAQEKLKEAESLLSPWLEKPEIARSRDVVEIYARLAMDPSLVPVAHQRLRKLAGIHVWDSLRLSLAVRLGDWGGVKGLLGDPATVLDSQALRDAHYAALEHKNKHPAVALEAARRLHAQNPTVEDEILYATALLANGEAGPALERARRFRDTGPQGMALYNDALFALLAQNPALVVEDFRKEAANYAQPWADAYADALRRTGDKKSLAEWLRGWAERPDLEPAKRQDLAYRLLDLGEEKAALDLFETLASGQPPENTLVQEYLFVARKNAPERARQWLLARCDAAPSVEQHGWLRHMAEAGMGVDVRKRLEKDPALLDSPEMAAFSADSLLNDNPRGADYARAVGLVIVRTEQIPVLQGLALRLQDKKREDLAALAYKRILDLHPGNTEALVGMGLMAYGRGNYALARTFLEQFAQLPQDVEPPPRAAEAWFALAESGSHLMKAKGAGDRAALYEKVVAILDATQDLSPASQALKAVALYRLDRGDEAASLFEDLIAQHPSNRNWRLDFAQELIARRDYARARKVLEVFPDKTSQALAAPRFIPAALSEDAAEESRASSVQEEAHQEKLRRALLLERINLEEGSTRRAAENLEALADANPENPETRNAAAQAALSDGRFRAAYDRLTAPTAATGDMVETRRLREEAARAYGPRLATGAEYRRVSGAFEIRPFVAGRFLVAPGYALEARFETSHVDATRLLRASGSSGAFRDDLWRGQIQGLYETRGGDALAVRLMGNGETPGVGVEGKLHTFLGDTVAKGDWHKPYWDTVTAVVEDATQDSLGVQHTVHWGPTATLVLDVSARRYNLRAFDDVVRSVVAQPSMNWAFWRGEKIQTSLAYTLDAEYLIQDRKGVDAFGARFNRLDTRSREIHFPHAALDMTVGERFWTNLYAGYAMDRLGGSGLAMGARATHWVTRTVALEAHADYGLETGATNNTALNVGLGLVWAGF